MNYKRYWLALAVVILASFAVLGSVGRRMITHAPPIPDVYTTDGQLLFSGATITDGQGVWQSIGGQEIGTVWGHGAYIAPDWSADWLHRESLLLLDGWARKQGAQSYAALNQEQQAALQARLTALIRTNTYDASANRVILSNDRVAAFNKLEAYYARSADFLQTPLMQTLRWMRVPGDALFTLGAVLLGWFVLGLLTGRSFEPDDKARLNGRS